MKIFLVHNFYQNKGGEGQVFFDEKNLLQAHDHQVFLLTKNNLEINEYTPLNKMNLAIKTHFSVKSYREIKSKLKKLRPDIAHFHNTLPLISPSAYYAAQDAEVPVIQTLHNYRLICPSGTLFRDGEICEDCMNKITPWPGIYHRCYRNSYLQSGVVASMLTLHRIIQTWDKKIDAYIALTNYAKIKLIQGGLPEKKIFIKPNFFPDPGPGSHSKDFVLYVGRLSEEKGVDILLKAMTNLREINLKIIGDGPLYDLIDQEIQEAKLAHVELMGALEHDAVIRLIQDSKFLIVPSKWYEGFPRVLVEAMACGTPAIVSDIGSLEEIVIDGVTGLHFKTNDPEHLANKIKTLWENQGFLKLMEKNARSEYESKYTPGRNYSQLMKIYESVL